MAKAAAYAPDARPSAQDTKKEHKRPCACGAGLALAFVVALCARAASAVTAARPLARTGGTGSAPGAHTAPTSNIDIDRRPEHT
eukprot:scaffold9936_cov130-Isochrysis_galbana.AAC.8